MADDGLRSAQALSDKLCKSKLSNGFTARDVRRNQWKYLTTDEAVEAALNWLEDEGWLQANEVGGSGPGSINLGSHGAILITEKLRYMQLIGKAKVHRKRTGLCVVLNAEMAVPAKLRS